MSKRHRCYQYNTNKRNLPIIGSRNSTNVGQALVEFLLTVGFWIIILGSIFNVFFGLWKYDMIVSAGNAATFIAQRDGCFDSSALTQANNLLQSGAMPIATTAQQVTPVGAEPSPPSTGGVVVWSSNVSTTSSCSSPTIFGSPISVGIMYSYNFNFIQFLPPVYVTFKWNDTILSEYSPP